MAAATVGDLVVRLGAVTQQYNSKMQQARATNSKFSMSVSSVSAGIRKMGAAALSAATSAVSKLANGFANVTRKALGFAAALVGVSGGLGAAGLGIVLKKRLEDMDALTKASRKLGASTEELGKIVFVSAQTAGLGVAETTKAIEFMVKSIGEVKRFGIGEAADAFGTKGLALDVERLSTLSPGRALLEIADAMQMIGTEGEKIDLAKSIFGRGGADFVNVLGAGRQEIIRLGREVEELGGLFSEDVGRGAEAANDAMNRLRTALSGLSIEAARDLAPFIQAFSDMLTDKVAADRFGESISDLTSEFGVFGAALLETIRLFDKLSAASFRALEASLTATVSLRVAVGNVKGAEVARIAAEVAGQRAFELENPERFGGRAGVLPNVLNAVRRARAQNARDAAGSQGRQGFENRFQRIAAENAARTAAAKKEFALAVDASNRIRDSLITPQQRTMQQAFEIQRLAMRGVARGGIDELTRRAALRALKGDIAEGPERQFELRQPRFAAATTAESSAAFSQLLASFRPQRVEHQRIIAKNTADAAEEQRQTNIALEEMARTQARPISFPVGGAP